MRLLFSLIPALLLSACSRETVTPNKTEVAFATHATVLRGTWRGTLPAGALAGHKLSLTLTPTLADPQTNDTNLR